MSSFHPENLPIAAHSALHNDIVKFLNMCLNLAIPDKYNPHSPPSAVDQPKICELIFRKIIVPSSQYLLFLFQNWYLLSGDVLSSFFDLLNALLQIGRRHVPTLQIMLSPQILLTIANVLSFIENNAAKLYYIDYIRLSLEAALAC
ncbi:hypothetical protein BLNAU_17999 [Blattamonas nauphoetae]|uniref:Uncharacterized protein n=1 Tax=Blattamonas nauphoetae TaxID=2049346 RepID=A0ABQ9X5M0_9EUKA|nr:hypothetical protein BLNAU_17999 [Blattamonas nauphoetae]